MKWFRFYSESLRDPKVQRLDDQTYRRWVNLLCLANEGKPRGQLPAVADIAYHLRISDGEANSLVDELIARELLDGTPDGYMPHNWTARQFKSDNTYGRVLKFRGKGDETFQETPGETLHETPPRRSKSRNVSETFPSLLTDPDSETDSETEPDPPTAAAEPAPEPVALPDSPPDGGALPRASPKPTTLNRQQLGRFERWYLGRDVAGYDGYPNKQQRPEAERAWRKLNPDDTLTAQLIADVQERRTGRKWAEGFVDYPAKYLNQRIWEDDIEPCKQGIGHEIAGRSPRNTGRQNGRDHRRGAVGAPGSLGPGGYDSWRDES